MTEILLQYGYWGLLIAAFLAATIIPFSSDVLLSAMIVAGFHPVELWIFAIIGNWAGGMVSYYMGRLGKWEWIEKYMGLKKAKVDRFHKRVKKYGPYVALVTWLPIIGDPMAIALGFARTPLAPTALFMFIGKGLRYVVIIWLTLQGIKVFG